jgi:hypothetical protein
VRRFNPLFPVENKKDEVEDDRRTATVAFNLVPDFNMAHGFPPPAAQNGQTAELKGNKNLKLL